MNEKNSSAFAVGKGRNPVGTVRGASSPLGEQEALELWGDLSIEDVLSRENLTRALRRVKENKGSAGVDNMTVEELEPYLNEEWPRILKELLEGWYKPSPVRRVMIPKPNGGERSLGIPTVLIRRYLQAGIMENGLTTASTEGTPQGGPLLSNVLLDELDKELERRGSAFCRYADDCNIYVHSKRAGERVKESVTKFLFERVKLKVNEKKSAIDRPWKRKFLGYTVTMDKATRLRVAKQSIKRLKDKLRDIFRGGRGCNIGKLIQKKLNPIIRGWKNYFRLSAVKWITEELDGWIRRRLRCILWRQMKRRWTLAKRLISRGIDKTRAWRSVNNGRGLWWNAGSSHMNEAFPTKYFQILGLVELKTGNLEKILRTAVYGTVRTVV